MRLYIYLIPQKIKSEYVDIDESFIEFKSFINEYMINNLINYLKDIKFIINNLNINYNRHRKYNIFNKYKKEKRVRFQYNQTDLFEKKKITEHYVHPIYKIPHVSFIKLKKDHKNILALIY